MEIVIDDTTGVLVPREEDAFAAALARVLADASLARSLGENARHDVERNWSWDAAADRLERELFATAGREHPRVPAGVGV
jgi:glycosyltransferase involved in cell wall biosynthesis